MDSLKPSEVVVSYSCLSRWNEPAAPPAKEESKTSMKGGKDKERESKTEVLPLESSMVLENPGLLKNFSFFFFI